MLARVSRVMTRVCPRPILRFIRDCVARVSGRLIADPRRVQRALSRPPTAFWERRIMDVMSCPDNQTIPRVLDAGRVRDGWIVMHNGLLVGGLSYYGQGMLHMLVRNRGVHEPQEELAFMEILPSVAKGSAMLEMGGYWAFYSLWFKTVVPEARTYVVEPMPLHLVTGMRNFERAGQTSVFARAYVGDPKRTSDDGTPVITVDDFCKQHGLTQLAILHADIQGAELEMLRGARSMFASQRIDFVFVSTHSDKLHASCLQWLKEQEYDIVASADLQETYSYDGLIVAKSPAAVGPSSICISKKRSLC